MTEALQMEWVTWAVPRLLLPCPILFPRLQRGLSNSMINAASIRMMAIGVGAVVAGSGDEDTGPCFFLQELFWLR